MTNINEDISMLTPNFLDPNNRKKASKIGVGRTLLSPNYLV